MENCNNFFNGKKWFHYSIIVAGVITLIILLTMLQTKKVITPEEKDAIEEVAGDMIEIGLTYKDGKYVVDTSNKTFYIDIT